jgi:two-component system sensor histidine kinase PilS (NtrC family)
VAARAPDLPVGRDSLPRPTTGLPLGSPALRFFFYFRLALALGLAVLFFSNQGPALFGQADRHIFASALVVYLFLIAANGIVMGVGLMSEEHQVQAMAVIDIAAFVTLMHASGGPASGLGLLNALTIAVGSLTMAGRQALLFAAVATLAVLGEQAYADLVLHGRSTAYTHAGLLGVAYFAIAALAHRLSLRLHESQRLVSRQEIDLANLQQVNDYVVRQLQTGVLVVGADGRLRQANAAARLLLGQPDLAIDRPVSVLSPPLARLLAEDRGQAGAAVAGFYPTAGGRSLRVRVNRLGEGGSAAVLVFLDDEAALAEEAQRIKLASLGQLTASIAHEIRNPLGAIGHAVQLLDESPAFDEADRQLAGIIRNNVQRVNEVIENVLQLSRRDRARPEPVALKPWVAQLAEDARRANRLEESQISLTLSPEDTTVVTDPRQMGQVVSVLLDNAATHYRGDRSGLRIAVEGGMAADGTLFLEVADNGPGIPPEVRGRIFEPFFSTRHNGTGLGLYLARELSEGCGVRLDLVPGPDAGCRFRLSFPDQRLLV